MGNLQMRTLLDEDAAIARRFANFVPPDSFFRSIAICSSTVRRATFSAWIHEAIEQVVAAAAHVTMPITLSDLQAMDTILESSHAADIYMSIFCQNKIGSADQATARRIWRACATSRTLVIRCIVREVGFHSEEHLMARLHAIFGPQCLVEDDQLLSKMWNCFHREVQIFGAPTAFRSNAVRNRRGRPRNRDRFEPIQQNVIEDLPDVPSAVISAVNADAPEIHDGPEQDVWLISPALEAFKMHYRGLRPGYFDREQFNYRYLDINDLSSDRPFVCASCPHDHPAYIVCVGGAPTSHVMVAFDRESDSSTLVYDSM